MVRVHRAQRWTGAAIGLLDLLWTPLVLGLCGMEVEDTSAIDHWAGSVFFQLGGFAVLMSVAQGIAWSIATIRPNTWKVIVYASLVVHVLLGVEISLASIAIRTTHLSTPLWFTAFELSAWVPGLAHAFWFAVARSPRIKAPRER